jgi:hypothetical protein
MIIDALPQELLQTFGAGEFDDVAWHRHFASAGRTLKRITCTPQALQSLAQAGIVLPERWDGADCGRIGLLLLAAQHLQPGALTPFVTDLYWKSSEKEQFAILQALPLLPNPEGWRDLGASACRSHVGTVFEAIACENVYPERYFPELNFNQMVLKAIFNGVSVKRIAGLEKRSTPELRRMVAAYASERRAAGRTVPDDVHFILGETHANL